MIEYLIIAIAFAIMIHFRYILEILGVVQLTRVLLDIEHEKNPFTPKIFATLFFILNIIFMPIMLLYIFRASRDAIIKEISTTILKSYFQLEEK